MNDFNNIFLLIKKHCNKQGKFIENDCFDIIAKEIGVPADKLPLYLNHLQDMGLITYSIPKKYIYLTSFGYKQKQLVKA